MPKITNLMMQKEKLQMLNEKTESSKSQSQRDN